MHVRMMSHACGSWRRVRRRTLTSKQVVSCFSIFPQACITSLFQNVDHIHLALHSHSSDRSTADSVMMRLDAETWLIIAFEKRRSHPLHVVFGISICISLCNVNGNAGATYNFSQNKNWQNKTKANKQTDNKRQSRRQGRIPQKERTEHYQRVLLCLCQSVCVFRLRKIDRKRMIEERCLLCVCVVVVVVVYIKKEDEEKEIQVLKEERHCLGFSPQAALDPRFPRRHPAQTHPQWASDHHSQQIYKTTNLHTAPWISQRSRTNESWGSSAFIFQEAKLV